MTTGLRPATDPTAGAWVSGAPWDRLACFGPPGFAAYARLRFVPDPVRPGMAEADVEVADDHPGDLDQTQRTLDLLARHTTTAERCFVGVWDGWGTDLPPGPVLHLTHRRYVLLEGPLDAVVPWAAGSGDGHVPALVWPADHAWCFASDVDPHWAGVGASAAAVRDLLDDPGLDVVVADPTQPQPTYGG